MKIVFCCFALAFCVVQGVCQPQAFLSVKSDSGIVHVYDDTLFLGATPLDSVTIASGMHILRYVPLNERNWYQQTVIETVSVAVGEHLKRSVSAPSYQYIPRRFPTISRIDIPADSLSAIPLKALEGKEIPGNTPLYLTTAGAVISGAIAAYCKLEADKYYDDFQRTGDQSTLDKVKRNDTISGIALVSCQINLAALTYFLLSR